MKTCILTYLGQKGPENLSLTHSLTLTPTSESTHKLVPFHNDFSPSGEQPEQRKSAHTLFITTHWQF